MRITLRKKVLGLIFVSVLVTSLVITFLSAMDIVTRGNERAKLYQETLTSERKQQIKGYVEMAAKIVQALPAKDVPATVQAMRYGDKGYVWLQDFNNIMLVHPDPRLSGTDQSDLKDSNGVFILRELSKMCRYNGEGFLNYSWKLPGQETMRPKLSFAKGIPKKNWIVGTGLYIDDIDAEVANERDRIKHDVIRTISMQLGGALAITALFMLLATYFVNRYITGPLEAITKSMKGFDNDLTTTVPVTTSDEVGELAGWLNQHLAKLHQIIRMVSEVTGELHAHAGTISGTMNQQTSFAAQLSSSVAEMTSTMEEFSSTATQIAQHSQGVVELADKTLTDSRQGSEVVESLTAKINIINRDIQANLTEIVELGRKSKEINKIMEIINDIANQTRLIAFNAALEAASAGESGKRFGVVAVEIRRLADNVVESTAEIEGKITEILDAVNRLVMSSEKTSVMMLEGQGSAAQTVSMLTDMVGGVEEATDAARQISLSIQQQQIASSQVVLSIREIEQGVRQSTDSARQTNIVANELAELSGKLKTLVTTFKINERQDDEENDSNTNPKV